MLILTFKPVQTLEDKGRIDLQKLDKNNSNLVPINMFQYTETQILSTLALGKIK